jgi:hypothetical protein
MDWDLHLVFMCVNEYANERAKLWKDKWPKAELLMKLLTRQSYDYNIFVIFFYIDEK